MPARNNKSKKMRPAGPDSNLSREILKLLLAAEASGLCPETVLRECLKRFHEGWNQAKHRPIQEQGMRDAKRNGNGLGAKKRFGGHQKRKALSTVRGSAPGKAKPGAGQSHAGDMGNSHGQPRHD